MLPCSLTLWKIFKSLNSIKSPRSYHLNRIIHKILLNLLPKILSSTLSSVKNLKTANPSQDLPSLYFSPHIFLSSLYKILLIPQMLRLPHTHSADVPAFRCPDRISVSVFCCPDSIKTRPYNMTHHRRYLVRKLQAHPG